MFERSYELFLFDVYIAILKIKYVSNKFKNDEELKHDFVSWDSVIREFEIIGEATKILIKNNIIDDEYQRVVDFRNKITHHYFGIDSEAVWSIVKHHLVDFESYIQNKLIHIDSKIKKEIFDDVLEENKHYDFILAKLRKLK